VTRLKIGLYFYQYEENVSYFLSVLFVLIQYLPPQKNWRDAKKFCQDIGMQLVVFETVDELKKVAAADPHKESNSEF